MSTVYTSLSLYSVNGTVVRPQAYTTYTVKTGDVVQFALVASAPVTVAQGSLAEDYSGQPVTPDPAHQKTISSGWPTLVLDNGASATYDPVASTSTTLIFDYTVQPGDTGSYVRGSSLNLTPNPGLTVNGHAASATIKDAGGASVTDLNAFGNPSSGPYGATLAVAPLTIDGSAPPALISIAPVGSSQTQATSVHFTVTFSEAVTGQDGTALHDPSLFKVVDQNGNVSTTATVTSVQAQPGNAVYDVTVSTLGEGTVKLQLASPDAVTDAHGFHLPGGQLSAGTQLAGSAGVAGNIITGNTNNFTNLDKIAVADLNGDGRPDIVTIDPAHNTLFIQYSAGLPNQTTATIQLSGKPSSLAVGDVNGDGIADIVIGYDNRNDKTIPQGTIDATNAFYQSILGTNAYFEPSQTGYDPHGYGAVLLGQGNGTFAAPKGFTVEAQTLALTTAFASDAYGFTDKVTLDPAAKTITVDLDNGYPNYTAPMTFSLAGLNGNPARVALDSSRNIYVFSDDGQSFAYFKNQVFQSEFKTYTYSGNGLVTTEHDPSGNPFGDVIYARTGAPLFGSSNVNLNSIAIGDLTTDGLADIVASDGTNGTAFLVRGQPSAFSADAPTPYTSSIGAGINPSAVALADLNQDGRQDLVFLDRGTAETNYTYASQLGVYYTEGLGQGEPAGQNAPLYTLADPNASRSYGVGTDPNLLVITSLMPGTQSVTLSTNRVLTILSGQPSGNLNTGALQYDLTSIIGSVKPLAIVAADMNRDGVQDLVVITNDGKEWELFGQITNGAWTIGGAVSQQLAGFTSAAYGSGNLNFQVSAAVADVDRDGRPDIVYTGFADNSSGSVSDYTYVSYNTSPPLTGNATYTIDRTPPAAPAITTLVNDTGAQGDFITSAHQLELAGTAEPNATVTILSSSGGAYTPLATGVADQNGRFDIVASTSLSDGTYQLKATATDRAGNTDPNAVGTAAVTIASAPPTLLSLDRLDPATHADGTVRYHAVFSSAVTGLTSSAVQVLTGGTLTGVSVASVTADAGSAGTAYTITLTVPQGTGPLQIGLDTRQISGSAAVTADGAGGHFAGETVYSSSDIGSGIQSVKVGSDSITWITDSGFYTKLLSGSSDRAGYHDSGLQTTDIAFADAGTAHYAFVGHKAGFGSDGTTAAILYGFQDQTTFTTPIPAYPTPVGLPTNTSGIALASLFDSSGTTDIRQTVNLLVTTSSSGLWLTDSYPTQSDTSPYPYTLLFNPAQQLVPGAAHGTPVIAPETFGSDGNPVGRHGYIAYQRDGFGVQIVQSYLRNGFEEVDNHTVEITRPISPYVYTAAAHYGDDRTESFRLADVNGDGTLDLVTLDDDTVGGHASQVTVRLGSGSQTTDYGTFETTGHSTAVTAADPASHGGGFALADFDGDGTLDLVFSDKSGQSVSFQHGNGDGTFGPATSISTGVTGDTLVSLDAADVNQDGHADVVATFVDGAVVLYGSGPIRVAPTYTIATPTVTIGPVSGGIVNAAAAQAPVTISGATTLIEDGRSVSVHVQAGSAGLDRTATVTGGVWTLQLATTDLASLADGTVTATATASDATGNAADPAAVTFLIDRLGPTVTFDAVTGDDLIDAGEAAAGFHLRGTTSDGTSVALTLTNAAGQTVVPSTILSVNAGVWDATLAPGLASGSYTVGLTATDAAGNATTATHAFTVHDPKISVLPVATDGVVDAAEAAAGFDVLGPVGDVPVGQAVTVQILDANGTTVVGPQTTPVQAGSNGVPFWGIHLNGGFADGLADGTYTVKADVSDAAGYAALQASSSFTVHAPKLVIGQVAGDGTLNLAEAQAGFAVSGTSVALEDGRVVTVKVAAGDGTVLQTYQSTVAGGHWSVAVDAATATGLADGQYTVTADATDLAGYAALQATTTLRVDETAPTLGIATVATDDVVDVTEIGSFHVAGTVPADVAAVTLKITDGSGTVRVTPSILPVVNGAWDAAIGTLFPNGLPSGSYTIDLAATDLAGNPASASRVFTVHDPQVSILPTATDRIVDATEAAAGLDIAGLINDVPAGGTVTVQILDQNGRPILAPVAAPVQLSTNGTPYWGFHLTGGFTNGLADGTYTIKADASDSGGYAAIQATDSFTIHAPKVAIDPVAANGVAVNLAQAQAGLAIGGSTVGVEDGRSVTLTVSDQNGAVVGTYLATVAGGHWSAPIPTAPGSGLADGVYKLAATATDAAGYTSLAATSAFTLDQTSPTLTVATVAGDDVVDATETAAFHVGGTASADVGSVTLQITDSQGNVRVTPSSLPVVDGHWDTAIGSLFPSGLTSGAYRIDLTATDLAGNPSATSHSFTIHNPKLGIAAVAGDDVVDATEAAAGFDIVGQVSDVPVGQPVTIQLLDPSGSPVFAPLTTTVQLSTNGTPFWGIHLNGAFTGTLADGTYTIKADVSDAGGYAANEAQHSFTIHDPKLAIDPVASNGVAVNLAQAQAGFAITGTAIGVEDGRSVGVAILDATNATIKTYQATVTGGHWSAAVDAATATALLSDGTYTITADATDAAGYAAIRAQASFQVDETAPTVAIAPVTADDILNASEARTGFTVSGTTQGVEDGRMVAVGIVDSGLHFVLPATNVPVQNGAWSLTGLKAPTLADGPYQVVAQAVDAAGNTSTAQGLTFTVDQTAPVLSIDTIAGDDRLNAAEASQGFVVSGTAAGLEAGRVVTLSATDQSGNTVVADTPLTVAGGVWSAGFSAAAAARLSDGHYTFTVTASDLAGNPALAVTHDLTIDKTLPAVTIGSVAGDDRVNASEAADDLLLSGTTTGVDDGRMVTLRIFDGAGNGKVSTTVPVTNGHWAADLPTSLVASFADGSYTLTADATDAAGNPAPRQVHGFTIDRAAPTLALGTVAGDNRINATEALASVTLAGTASGLEDGQAVTLVLHDGTGAAITTLAAVTSGGAFQATLDAATVGSLSEGGYTVTADALDVAGNAAATASVAFVVDKTAPALTVATVTTDDRISAAEAAAGFAIAGTAPGAENGQPVTVQIANAAGTVVGAGTATVAAEAWTLAIGSGFAGSLADGTYYAVANVKDLAGNPAAQQAHAFVVDKTAPALTVATVTTDDRISAAEAAAGFAIAGTAPGAENGQPVTVQIANAAGTVVGAGTATVAAEAWTLAIGSGFAGSLADGTYYAVANVKDLAGNPAAQQAHAFVVDKTAPALTVATVTTDDRISAAEAAAGFAIAGTAPGAENGQPVTVQIANAAGTVVGAGTATVAAEAWTLAIGSGFAGSLADGTYYAVANVKDLAGNPAAQQAHAFVVDKTAPALTVATVTTDDRISAAEAAAGFAIAGTAPGAENGQPVTVQIANAAGTVVGAGTATVAAEAWTLAIGSGFAGSLADGTYYAVANVKDLAGNPAAQQAHAFVIDKTAPLISLNPPPDTIQASSADGAVVTFTGSAADAIDGQDSVTFNEGARVVASGDVFSPGQHTITASASDTAGNAATAASFSFTVTSQSGSMAQTSGRVIDGYLAGATVFADANGNGALDPGEASTTTDAVGAYTLPASGASIVVRGGIDIATKLPFSGTLSAPAGSSVVTPLTTLVDRLAASMGGDVLGAEASVRSALGLDPSIDLTSLDPIAAVQSGLAGAAKALAASAALLDTTTLIAATGATGDVFAALADRIAGSSTPLDLTSTATLQALATASGADPSTVAATAALAAASNALIDQRLHDAGDDAGKLLTDVTSVSATAQGSTASSLEGAGSDPEQLAVVVSQNSADALSDKVALAASQLGPIVVAINHAPVAVADALSVGAHAIATGSVLANDSDPDAGGAVHVVAVRFAGGTPVPIAPSGAATILGEHGTLQIAADGHYSYVGNAAGADAFSVTIADDHGATASSALTATVAAASGAASDATFAFGFLASSVTYLGGEAILTGPDGVAHDVTGIGHLHFTDGTIDEADGSPLVDDLFYDAHNKDVYAAHLDPDAHYAQFGWREGRDPNALFSTDGYLAANPDVKAAGLNPLQHYDQFGWQEGREGGLGFSAQAYLAMNPDVSAAGVDPLAHYLSYGQAEGRALLPAKSIAQGSADHLYGDFDATFYLATYRDVAAAASAAGGDPDSFALTHYLQFGAKEGRDPNAYFSTTEYLTANPDVAAAGTNPLVHYEIDGAKEGRAASMFDTDGYLAVNPDVAAAQVDPLGHFLQFGMAEGRVGWHV